MATHVSRAGGIPPANTPVGALYRDVLARTGDPQAAMQAAAYANAGLKEVYNRTMVQTGGDQNAARMAQQRFGPDVVRLAGLIPGIQAGGAGAAGDLRQALGITRRLGVSDSSQLNGWLNAHVQDDAVLEGAGLDPSEVRAPPDTPWAHADLDALVSLVRDSLTRYRGADGAALDSGQIEAYLDRARTAAQKYGVGAARAPATGDTAAGVQSLAALGVPIRV